MDEIFSCCEVSCINGQRILLLLMAENVLGLRAASSAQAGFQDVHGPIQTNSTKGWTGHSGGSCVV
jgi:hypothetical protein